LRVGVLVRPGDVPERGPVLNGATRRSRRPRGTALAALAVALLVTLAAAFGLSRFFSGRDTSTLSSAAGPGQAFPDRGARHLAPGEAAAGRRAGSDPPTSGAHVPIPVLRDGVGISDDQLLHAIEEGNVVLLYGARRPPAGLSELADRLAGPFDRRVAAAGQAVILARRGATAGIVAVAWRHLQRVPDARDPRLRAFVEYWLGRGREQPRR